MTQATLVYLNDKSIIHTILAWMKSTPMRVSIEIIGTFLTQR